jgi:hypothetical protein
MPVERHRDVEFEVRHGSLVAFVMLTRMPPSVEMMLDVE